VPKVNGFSRSSTFLVLYSIFSFSLFLTSS